MLERAHRAGSEVAVGTDLEGHLQQAHRAPHTVVHRTVEDNSGQDLGSVSPNTLSQYSVL